MKNRNKLMGVVLWMMLIMGCAHDGKQTASHHSTIVLNYWTFDNAAAGNLQGWQITQTRPSVPPARWQVQSDPTAPSAPQVLSIVEAAHSHDTFNLAVVEGFGCLDVDIEVQIQANAGESDQGGGVVWRYQDANNYYLCRLNPLEDNLRVYKVVNGTRQQLQGVSIGTVPKRWYSLRVSIIGSRIDCYLNRQRWLTVEDDTFASPGSVGVWAKGDARTSFDSLMVKSQ